MGSADVALTWRRRGCGGSLSVETAVLGGAADLSPVRLLHKLFTDIQRHCA